MIKSILILIVAVPVILLFIIGTAGKFIKDIFIIMIVMFIFHILKKLIF